MVRSHLFHITTPVILKFPSLVEERCILEFDHVRSGKPNSLK
jgi:hypothetical protein